jgi:hypothetical protein
MALPTYQSIGNLIGGTGTATPGNPTSYAANDIIIAIVEGAGGAHSISANGSGWNLLNQAVGVGTSEGTQCTRISVWWFRATSSSHTMPTFADSGNHTATRCIVFRGAPTTGNPFDITSIGDTTISGATSVTHPSVVTTVTDCLILHAATLAHDSSAAHQSAQANSSLTGITERADSGSISGNGGGISLWEGGLAAGGDSGTSTATFTPVNANNYDVAMVTMALKSVDSVPIGGGGGGNTSNFFYFM